MSALAEAIRDDGAVLVTDDPAAMIVMADGRTRVLSRSAAVARGGWVTKPNTTMPAVTPSALAELAAYRAELLANEVLDPRTGSAANSRTDLSGRSSRDPLIRAARRLVAREQGHYDPLQPRDHHGQWSHIGGLVGKALESLTDMYGPGVAASGWGEHGDDEDHHGWVTLHEDGTLALSYARDDGNAQSMLDSVDLKINGEWGNLRDHLRDAADAVAAGDEEHEPVTFPSASAKDWTYQVSTDHDTGLVTLETPEYSVEVYPHTAHLLADAVDDGEIYLDRWDDGAYDDGPLPTAAGRSAIRAADFGFTDGEIRALLPLHLWERADDDQLKHYWTKTAEGLAKWAKTKRPWTKLYDHLVKFLGPERAKRVASAWFISVFHFAAGSDKNRVLHGKKPRGKLVGPG